MSKGKEESILKNHICLQPFRHIELFKSSATLCCPSWLKKELKYKKDENGNFIYDVWNSEEAQEIRESILDGSYKFCDKKLCPHLNTLLTTGEYTDMFVAKNNKNKKGVWPEFHFPFCDVNGVEVDNKIKVEKTPGQINFTFDDSCNFKCPSCRLDTIMARPDEVKEIDKIVDFINQNYARDCRRIVITGSGDPFASKSFRKFLFEFDPKKWPNLKVVYLVSNGKLFNEQNWNKMKSIQPYVTDVEISIDAGTKDTYENKTRLGGDWEVLMDNLKFISTIDTIKTMRISFIVQKHNYKEMSECADLVYDIFKDRIDENDQDTKPTLFFGKISKWPHMTEKNMEDWDVSNPKHENHKEFLNELKKVYTKNNKIHIQSNLTYLLNSMI